MIPDDGDRRRPLALSDLEEAELTIQDQENAAHMLEQIGSFLDHADRSLNDLDQQQSENGAVSSAILRGCRDLAGSVRQVADELDQQTEQDRRALAQACLADIQASPLLLQDGESLSNVCSNDNAISSFPPNQQLMDLSDLDENDLVQAMEAAKNFLYDVESSLLMVDQDAADELAEVGLTVARLFVASLQSVHAQIAPEDLVHCRRAAPQMDIEILEDDDDDAGGVASEQRGRRRRLGRLRVLWPPLGPKVTACCGWIKNEAIKRPILAAALGIALWPVAVTTAFVGAPLVLVDGFVQDFYNHFQDAPLIVGLERGAAHLYHTGRLALLSGKLVGRQTVYVVRKQVARHGGVGPIAHRCVDMAVDRALHPVETIQSAWGGVCWSLDRVKEMVRQVQEQDQERAAQDLTDQMCLSSELPTMAPVWCD